MSKFRIVGSLRHLSHAETSRVFQRAMVRGGIVPVYSQGYNPHPRMSLPLPRSVGVEAEDDLFCVRMRQGRPEGFDEKEFKAKLAAQLPAGCELITVAAIKGKVSLQPVEATYVFKIKDEALGHGLTQEKTEELRNGLTWINADSKEEEKEELRHGLTQGKTEEIRHPRLQHSRAGLLTQINTEKENLKEEERGYVNIEELRKRIEEILGSEKIEIERRVNEKGSKRVLDVRSYIKAIELGKGGVEVQCGITATGSIRVEEILGLLKLDIEKLESPIRRRNVRWEGLMN